MRCIGGGGQQQCAQAARSGLMCLPVYIKASASASENANANTNTNRKQSKAKERDAGKIYIFSVRVPFPVLKWIASTYSDPAPRPTYTHSDRQTEDNKLRVRTRIKSCN